MAPIHQPLHPNAARTPLGIRKIHIQNLVDLLNACLLRGEIERATRAWSILIRCREVDWRSRWRWGLALLTASQAKDDLDPQPQDREGGDISKWLRGLRVSVHQDEKPAIMHALILHLIRQKQYREALDELETYLTSYPYLLSGPLHTYAGMLAFYLAQPPDLRGEGLGAVAEGPGGVAVAGRGDGGSASSSPPPRAASGTVRVADVSLVRQARVWFVKAQDIGRDEVAAEFVRIIDSATNGTGADLSDDDDDDDDRVPPAQPSLYSMLHPDSESDDLGDPIDQYDSD